LRATWFPGRPSAPALVCLPGGSYNRHYFDLHVPGLSGYSFAEAMQRRGFTVVTIDNLGTGQSSRLTRDVELYDQAAALSLATEALPRIIDHDGPLIGVGHSMGGQRLPSFIRRRAGPSPHWPSLALRPSGSNP
jgi:alpha-beta hydrolase superfamily lysophospholipase